MSVDLVVIFRPSAEVGAIVDEALRLPNLKAVWTQKGIVDDLAAARVLAAGAPWCRIGASGRSIFI